MASILFVAYHFAPENTSGTHRSLHFARALMDAGHDVTVIAGPQPPASRSDPGLERVFPWRDRVHRVDIPMSLGSLYVKLKPRRRVAEQNGAAADAPAYGYTASELKEGFISRLRHHVRVWEALPDHIRTWSAPAVKTGRALGKKVAADVVIASGPPWTGVMVGHRVARALRVPFIADFRDPWSAGSGAKWRAGTDWAQRRVERWEQRVLADAAVVCFNSPRLASVSAQLSSLGSRTCVILNGSDVPRQAETTVIPNSRPLRLRHFGSLYVGRTVFPLVKALDDLIASGAIRQDEVEVDLIGDIESEFKAEQLKSTRVIVNFTPHLKFSEAAKLMGEPSVLICMQTDLHVNLIPTKLFDYLCTGNPILALSSAASATWDISSQYQRSYRLDLESVDWNREVLLRLIETWRRGELRQESAVEDTRHIGKDVLGEDFVRLVARIAANGSQARR
jgi:Glycosyl transferase 4-like domain